MSDTKIYLELSDEIQAVLADNGLSVEDILRREDIDASVSHGLPPCEPEEGARSNLSTVLEDPKEVRLC